MMRTLLFFLFLFPAAITAQVLTADEALKIGMKNNYDILVAKNQAEADSIMNAAGEAGMLPTIALNGGVGLSQGNINQVFVNGNEFSSTNNATNLNAGIALSWTLFDGTRMFVTKRKLEQVQLLGNYLFREQVLNTGGDILLAYYDIVRQKQQIDATDEIIRYNEERVKILEARMTAGVIAKPDVLLAKIDLNVQKENRLRLQLLLGEAKRRLNLVLARDVMTPFEVTDSIPLSPIAGREQLEQRMYAANPTLMAFKAQVEITKLAYREATSQYWPRVTLNAGYNFIRSQNTAGFSLYNQNYGWNTGLTVSIPLYQAGRVNRERGVAALNIESAEYRLQQASFTASLALQNALNVYDSYSQSLALEEENRDMAREAMQLSLDRLRLGHGNALEVAQAQATLAASLFRLSGFQYDLKSAEINVHRQAAEL
jgi:outer membrane protein